MKFQSAFSTRLFSSQTSECWRTAFLKEQGTGQSCSEQHCSALDWAVFLDFTIAFLFHGKLCG